MSNPNFELLTSIIMYHYQVVQYICVHPFLISRQQVTQQTASPICHTQVVRHTFVHVSLTSYQQAVQHGAIITKNIFINKQCRLLF